MRKIVTAALAASLFISPAVFAVFITGEAIADSRDRLLAELLKLETQPCGTPLYLVHDPTERQWSITCEGCAVLPVRKVFPPEDMTPVIEFAEEMKTPRGQVDINDMYLLAGRCSAKHLKW